MKKPSVGHVVVIVAIFLSIASLPLFLGKKDSSKSPEPVPVSPGVPSQTVQSDTELAKQVEGLYYLVPFCEKNKTEFNWAKCFAKSDTLRSRIKLLTDPGTPPPERDQARNYVRSFLASEPLTTTKDRLQKDIGNHLKGIPDNFWNSVELQQQVTRAKQLASLADPVSLKLLLSSARPEVRKTAVLLKAQRPLFQAVVSKYTAKQDCKLNEVQSALRKSRAPVLTVPDGVAFCDFPPEIVITSKVGIYEAQMPKEGRAFDQILKSVPKLYADELLVSSEKQATITKAEFAKNRGIEKYISYQIIQSEIGSKDKVTHTCSFIKKATRNEIRKCKEAVDVLVQFDQVTLPANIASRNALKSCLAKQVEPLICKDQATNAWRAKAIKLLTADVSLKEQLQNLDRKWKLLLVAFIGAIAVMVWGFLRKSFPSLQVFGTSRRHGRGKL